MKYFGKYQKSFMIGELHGNSGFKWIIDPFDGTINFKAGIAYFCISAALEKDGLKYSELLKILQS